MILPTYCACRNLRKSKKAGINIDPGRCLRSGSRSDLSGRRHSFRAGVLRYALEIANCDGCRFQYERPQDRFAGTGCTPRLCSARISGDFPQRTGSPPALVVEVTIKGFGAEIGEGPSKKEAERASAGALLAKIRVKNVKS